ncbi:hypothetical protein JNB62_13200 [Microbacterium jejuense]|uniref:Phage tail protein n=1 Tax=Microbacterium jejuense TaxID=1263637 RepID=A0ABS7HQZ7_9MICO|nr:hypothetical protein [Microbacterium jejuense]MBW9094647.1 hypothetical protein [Microbacterium jejuense]
MRDGAPDEVIAGACFWYSRVTSWLGGRLLASTVPIISGRATGKVDQEVIEEVSLTVPRFAAAAEGEDVADWRPGTDTLHPLARYGQVLDVTVVVVSVITGTAWETRVGRYQVKDWDDDDAGLISVKGESLLARPRDDKLTAPTSPSSTATFISEARRLAPAGMGVSFEAGLIDRALPQAFAWSESRLDAWRELAAAWPALLRIDPWGQARFRAPLPAVPAPVITLTDGARGTLISAPRADSRAGAPNLVAVTTQGSDTADVVGISAITSGPMSVNGDYGIVTKKWSSGAVTNLAEATAAAKADLDASSRPAQIVPAQIAPDPRLELDDPVELLREGDQLWGYVTAYDMPLTAGDGAMRVDVGLT